MDFLTCFDCERFVGRGRTGPSTAQPDCEGDGGAGTFVGTGVEEPEETAGLPNTQVPRSRGLKEKVRRCIIFCCKTNTKFRARE